MFAQLQPDTRIQCKERKDTQVYPSITLCKDKHQRITDGTQNKILHYICEPTLTQRVSTTERSHHTSHNYVSSLP